MANGEDDFITPSNPDLYEDCDKVADIYKGEIILPLFSSLSIACYLYVLWMYYALKSPVLRRHPTTLAVYKCIFEMIFLQQYLWVPSIRNQRFFDDDHVVAPYSCHATPYAGGGAFATQFALVGSELCFFIISYDLRSAYTNPFSSFKEMKVWYFMGVVGFSLFTGICLLLMGPEVYGMSFLGLLWIQNRRADHSINFPKMVLYYMIAGAVYAYSLWANFRYSMVSGRGFSKSLSNRLSIMQRSRNFTLGYVGFGCFVFFVEFISFLMNGGGSSPVPAYLLAFRGVWGLLVIGYCNKEELTWALVNPFRNPFHVKADQDMMMKENVAMERLLLQPHLNTALRAEILYFTTQGIMYAAREHRRMKTQRAALLYGDDGREVDEEEGAAASKSNAASRSKQAVQDLLEAAKTGRKKHGDKEQQHSYTLNASSPHNVNGGGGGGGGRAPQAGGNASASAVRGSTGGFTSNPLLRSSFGDAYPTPFLPRGSSTKTVEGSEVTGVDLLDRNSVAQFERFNEEQDEAVNKVIDQNWEEEMSLLGVNTKKTRSVGINSMGSSSVSSGGGTNTVERGVELQSVAPSARRRRSSARDNVEFEFSPEASAAADEGEDGDEGEIGEAGANQPGSSGGGASASPFADNDGNSKTNSSSHRVASVERSAAPLWSRVEDDGSSGAGRVLSSQRRSPSRTASTSRDAAADADAGTNAMAYNDAAGRTQSVGSDSSSLSSSQDSVDRSSRLTRLVATALSSASERARSFFTSTQFKEFRFKDFCPKLFGQVRELCGIDDEEYAQSFTKTCKEKFSEGRSGAFMFFSINENCIVKTTTKTESQALSELMPQYVEHLKQNPDSLICRFLGSHCITMYDNELYFVVMQNVFPKFPLSERYDLKGSWVNRHGFQASRKTKKERMRREPLRNAPLYQDNDLQQKISLELDVTYALASQIRRDVIFLRENALMDYSLLIGVRRENFKVVDDQLVKESTTTTGTSSSKIENSNKSSSTSNNGGRSQPSEAASTPTAAAATTTSGGTVSGTNKVANTKSAISGQQENSSAKIAAAGAVVDRLQRDENGGMRARVVEGPGTYYAGIIDILQEWNFEKKVERFLKIYFKRYDADGISAIEPLAYSERFWRGAVLDTFDGLTYETESLLHWRGDECDDADTCPV